MLDLNPAWASVAIALGALVYTIYSGRSKARADKVVELEKLIMAKADKAFVLAIDDRVDKLEDRATKVEATVSHLPDKDFTHRLELSITQLRGEVSTLTESVKPVAAIAGRLQEAMLEKALS
ncbi:DUF2730 family protein [Xanthobacteraceae bacterium Astr-EGSB]|uniref:DUF2730 family protein n=1 Tax=Astrobacterium formosum TaxID=3069710 RepID=UPI0027AFF47A|nr:DUF2730 family protein [Xanthobacteraceae bacterium Astr-EGSB]